MTLFSKNRFRNLTLLLSVCLALYEAVKDLKRAHHDGTEARSFSFNIALNI